MALFIANPILWVAFIIMAAISTSASDLPEELTGPRCSHEHTINLPTSRKCLVPVSTAYDWTVAQTKCEQVKGTLYTLTSGTLETRPQLLRCLESMDSDKFNDMWINGVSLWSPHFRWINGTVLNNLRYCPSSQPPIPYGEQVIKSISLDYCVTQCGTKRMAYTVIDADIASRDDNLKCYCTNTLSPTYQDACQTKTLDHPSPGQFYVVSSQSGSQIEVASSSTFSTSGILCALLDNNTFVDNHLKSDSCFTLRAFICALDSVQACSDANTPRCTAQQCNFMAGGRCLKRVNFPYSWYAASHYCRSQGGDLWVYKNVGDLLAVSKELSSDIKYWIGATNYQWTFNADSSMLYPLHGDYRTARCAHIYRRRIQPSGHFFRTMEWSDTPCDQGKSFLCEFDRDRFKQSEIENEVTCPWPIINPLTPAPGALVPGTLVPVAGSVSTDDDSFPWAAVMSGIVAGLVLLTCLGLICGLCRRRRRAKERVAFVPYFAGDTSHVEFETMSNADHMRNMRSASEHGSQAGLMKGGYHDMSAFGIGNSHAEFSSKSLDRRHLEAMERKFADSQQYLANNSMEERAYSSSYQTMPARGREYMTLQANMDIQDEAQLEALRRSLRGKPEVTLVTDHVDMNFTVNHAHGNSRGGSDLERSMEELHVPSSSGGFEHRNRSFTDIALHDL